MGKGRGATLLLWNWTQLSTAVLYRSWGMPGRRAVPPCSSSICASTIVKTILFDYLTIKFIYEANTARPTQFSIMYLTFENPIKKVVSIFCKSMVLGIAAQFYGVVNLIWIFYWFVSTWRLLPLVVLHPTGFVWANLSIHCLVRRINLKDKILGKF